VAFEDSDHATQEQAMQTIDFATLELPEGFALASNGPRLRDTLAEITGLSWDDAAQGRLELHGTACGKQWHSSARVQFERGDDLRIALDVQDQQSPRELLAATLRLPGNLRFAFAQSRMSLLADARLDGVTHLGETFRLLRGAMEAAAQSAGQNSNSAVSDNASNVTEDQVDKALSAAGLDEESLVRLDHGWELRPKLHGEPTPVQVGIDEQLHGRELRLHHELLSIADGHAGWNAAAQQALRFNARLRHARLAADGGRIVAEARLHGEQIQPSWLLTSARAVAAAARHCQTALLILAEQPETAKRYEEMFFQAGGWRPEA
jgi:hypothetical protein